MVIAESLISEINRARWTWARTYEKTALHWYILKDRYPGLFWRLSEAIEAYGVNREFRDSGKVFRYLVIGDFQFWRIGKVINRAHKDAR